MTARSIVAVSLAILTGCVIGPMRQIGETAPPRPPQVGYSGQPTQPPYVLGEETRDHSYYDDDEANVQKAIDESDKAEDSADTGMAAPDDDGEGPYSGECEGRHCHDAPASWDEQPKEKGKVER